MISYNNSAPKAVNNVGQFGATEGSIGAYKSAAEYAADAKYWALLSQTKYSSVEEILAEVERLYEQGRLLEEDIKQLKNDFTNQSQTLLGLIQSTGEAIDNTNAATELSKEATQEVLAQLDIISNMTVQTTLLPPNSLATGSYDNLTGVFSFGIPEGKPGRDGTDGTISDIGSVSIGTPQAGDYGFYVDKDDGGLYRSSMSDIANLVPSVRSVSVNGGPEQTGTVSLDVVSSFNGRKGIVVPQSGDYSVSQITGAAASGSNSDITSITGLTTALDVNQGGTGATTPESARTNLGLGLVSTESIVPITKGGTGSTSAENARLALVAAKSGDNSDITSMTNKITFTQSIIIPDGTANNEALNRGQLGRISGETLVGGGLYSDIRSFEGIASQIKCTGRLSNKDGGEGWFFLDTSDTTSVDNGGTVLVDTKSRRWKRAYDGAIKTSWFGVKEGGDSSSALSSALNLGGGQLFVKDGSYTLNSKVTVDHTNKTLPVLGRKSQRFDLKGSSMSNTIFNTNGNDGIEYIGTDGSVAGQGVHSGSTVSDFSLYGSGKTGVALRLTGLAYAKVEDLNINDYNIAMRLSGCLSSDIKRINAQRNNYGMYISSGTNSTFNAMRLSGMFGANSKFAIEGEVGTNVYIEDSNFEGNGTDGDTGSGAIFLRVVEPLSTINISGYFEANVGQADIIIDNQTSSPCVVNLKGCVFNRGGMRGGDNLGKGCNYNFQARSTGGGIIILNLDGCVFFTQTAFGYTPSGSKPYIKPESFLIVNGESTCYFSETTSRAYTGSRDTVLGLSVSSDGSITNAPSYITMDKAGTGVYVINSTQPFARNVSSYQVVGTSKVSGTHVSYAQKVSTGQIRVVTRNDSDAVADTAFDLIISTSR